MSRIRVKKLLIRPNHYIDPRWEGIRQFEGESTW